VPIGGQKYHITTTKPEFHRVSLSHITASESEFNVHPTYIIVGFEVLTVVVMKSSIFWNRKPSSPLKVKCSACQMLHAGFLLGFSFKLEGEGEDGMFF
jgi:hypothetical protein